MMKINGDAIRAEALSIVFHAYVGTSVGTLIAVAFNDASAAAIGTVLGVGVYLQKKSDKIAANINSSPEDPTPK